MKANVYALRVESHRLVAAEVDDRQAAKFLDAGRPVLLASSSELVGLARARNKALIIFASQPSTGAGKSISGSQRPGGRLAEARVA